MVVKVGLPVKDTFSETTLSSRLLRITEANW